MIQIETRSVQEQLIEMVNPKTWVDILIIADSLPRCKLLLEACMAAGVEFSLPGMYERLDVLQDAHPLKERIRCEAVFLFTDSSVTIKL